MGDTISRVSLRMGCCLVEAVAVLLDSTASGDLDGEEEDCGGTFLLSFSSEGGGGDTLESEETLTLVDDGESSLLTC